MRIWIAWLVLLLSACLTSEPPTIPRSELVQPAGLEGRYWAVSVEDGQIQARIVEFRARADGQIAIAADRDTAELVRLIGTAVPDVYLCVYPIDFIARSAAYVLLVLRDYGVWDLLAIEGIEQGSFGRANRAYLQERAARRGLSLDDRDPDITKITGNVHGSAIPELFRDMNFLAALRVKPLMRFLPSPSAPLAYEPPRYFAGIPLQLELVRHDLLGAQWVQPTGFEGDYVHIQPSTRSLQRVRRLPDGRFEVIQDDRAVETFGLLPLDSESDQYMWLSFNYVSPSFHSVSILRRDAHGWQVARVLRRHAMPVPGTSDLLTEPMNAAARRQGMTLEEYTLKGADTAQSLLALLNDGQFTTGLFVDWESAEHYKPVKADRR